jgi:hypothetical protein
MLIHVFTTLTTLLLATPASQPSAAEVTTSAVLGIELGMTIDEARTILARHGSQDSRPTREGGTKEVWRLSRTGFDWIAIKANANGRLVWITGHRRTGKALPFDVVGAPPDVSTTDTAVWHRPGRFAPQKLTLRGRERRAEVVTLTENVPLTAQ